MNENKKTSLGLSPLVLASGKLFLFYWMILIGVMSLFSALLQLTGEAENFIRLSSDFAIVTASFLTGFFCLKKQKYNPLLLSLALALTVLLAFVVFSLLFDTNGGILSLVIKFAELFFSSFLASIIKTEKKNKKYSKKRR